MNMYTQIASITLGGLLSISEILPFLNIKTNGIIHFIVTSLIKDISEYDEHNDIENECHEQSTETTPLLPSVNIKHELQEMTKELKDELKGSSFEKGQVQEIVEMILQHLQDLQRAQTQWTINYGEANIKNDIKYETTLQLLKELKINNNANDFVEKVTSELKREIGDIDEMHEMIPDMISNAVKYNINTVMDELYIHLDSQQQEMKRNVKEQMESILKNEMSGILKNEMSGIQNTLVQINESLKSGSEGSDKKKKK